MTINFATGFSAIRNQETAVRRLTGLLRSGNIPHAFLFTGIDGIGKKKTALTFAGALNCQRVDEQGVAEDDAVVPCGKCRPCKKIASGHHPDIIVVAPEKSRIKIAAIRDLGRMLAVKPYEARQRVVIIDQAQAMNPKAGNALLKLLEEPPRKTFLILTAGNTYSLLSTVVSRCQQVKFKPIPEHSVVTHLEKKGVPHEEAAILGKLANGSFGKADSLADTDWVNRRQWILQVIEPQDAGKKDSGQAVRSLAFSEILARDREAILDTLEFMKSWFRDLAVVRADSDRVVNKDQLDRIRQTARRYRTPRLLSKIDVLEAAQKNIEANANIRLTLDVMMMNL